MQVRDYSPPKVPTRQQQRDALQKGLGRAMQWAASGQLAEEPLLHACLHDQRHDAQIEDNRGEWLWKVMQQAAMVARLRRPILHALQQVTTECDANQLCDLALHYARQGDAAFESGLYELVTRQPVPDCPYVGEGQLLELGGERALRLIAQLHGQTLATREWEWYDTVIADRAVEKFGAQRVNEWLSATGDPDIERFARVWQEQANPGTSTEQQDHADRMRAITLEEVLRATEYPTTQDISLRGWGIYANESDVKIVFDHLWTVADPAALVRFLKIFSKRAFPAWDERLLALCRHSDPQVQSSAINALENISHPLVRAFAFAELQERSLQKSVVGLLEKNCVAGDEQSLLELLHLPEDDTQRHWLLIDVLNVLKENPAADCSELGLVAYFETPCEMCRFKAVRLLSNQRAAPPWLLTECRHDSSEESRELVQRLKDRHALAGAE